MILLLLAALTVGQFAAELEEHTGVPVVIENPDRVLTEQDVVRLLKPHMTVSTSHPSAPFGREKVDLLWEVFGAQLRGKKPPGWTVPPGFNPHMKAKFKRPATPSEP